MIQDEMDGDLFSPYILPMDDDTLKTMVGHLIEVEHLSIRQISEHLLVSRKKIMRVMGNVSLPKKRPGIIEPYRRLVDEWYHQYPRLKAIQVLERLKSYGFTGGYTTVKEYTMTLRKKRKRQAYHELNFLPGKRRKLIGWSGSFPSAQLTASSFFSPIPGTSTEDSTRSTHSSFFWTAISRR